jgi:tetratricopeptide (TPR) repeat protein
MILAPGLASPHLNTARCLAASQGALARKEYRLAFSLGYTAAIEEAVGRWTTLDELYEVAPDTPDGLATLARALSPLRPADAAQVYARLSRDFGRDDAILNLAEQRMAAGDLPGALALARKRMQEAPRDENSYRLAAWIFVQQGKEEDAHQILEQGLHVLPESRPILESLADHMIAVGRFVEARRYAERIPTVSPEALISREILSARALAGSGRITAAIRRAEEAVDVRPERTDSLLLLAQLQVDAGLTTDARVTLQRAAKTAAGQAAAQAHILVIKARLTETEQKGDRETAKEAPANFPAEP